MSTAALRHAQVRAALAELLPPPLTPTPFAMVDLFERELDDYAEIVVGPGGRPAGFMTRGEGPSFTARAQIALEHLGMSEDAAAHHLDLARLFEHQRAFLKLEWSQTDAGIEPLVACYFRRRPEVAGVLERLAARGVDAAVRQRAAEVAAALDKQTIHFVSAAFRPGHPIRHKLYFSQLVDDNTRERVASRVSRVFELFGMLGLQARWQAGYNRWWPGEGGSLFVSLSFSADRVAPWFKIDMPDVNDDIFKAWTAPAERAGVLADAARASRLAGTRRPSYVGVRIVPDPARLAFKYYADVP